MNEIMDNLRAGLKVLKLDPDWANYYRKIIEVRAKDKSRLV